MSEMMVDVSFLGCDGIDEEIGFWSSSYESLAITRLMVKQSRSVYYAVDSSKFGRKAMWLLETLRPVRGGVITDDGIPASMRATLEKTGWHVIVVPVARTDGEIREVKTEN